MLAARIQIAAHQIIGAGQRECRATRPLEQQRMPRDLLEPFHQLILAHRFSNAGRKRPATAHEHDGGQGQQQRHREAQQERVIEREHRKADGRTQHQVDAREQQQRRALLHRHHFQEAVHQLRRVHALQRCQIHVRQSMRKVRGQPHEDASLHHLGCHMLDGPKRPSHRQAHEQHQRDGQQRLHEWSAAGAERQIAHEGVHGQRQCQIQQARDRAEDADRPQFGRLRPHERQQSAHRRGRCIATMPAIGGIAVRMHRRVGQRHRHDSELLQFVLPRLPKRARDLALPHGDGAGFGRVTAPDARGQGAMSAQHEPALSGRGPGNDGHGRIRHPRRLRHRHAAPCNAQPQHGRNMLEHLSGLRCRRLFQCSTRVVHDEAMASGHAEFGQQIERCAQRAVQPGRDGLCVRWVLVSGL